MVHMLRAMALLQFGSYFLAVLSLKSVFSQLPQWKNSHWPHLLLPGMCVMCACVTAAPRSVRHTYLDTIALCEAARPEKNNWLPWIIAPFLLIPSRGTILKHMIQTEELPLIYACTQKPASAFSTLKIPASTLSLLLDSQDTKPQAEYIYAHWGWVCAFMICSKVK